MNNVNLAEIRKAIREDWATRNKTFTHKELVEEAKKQLEQQQQQNATP